MSGPIQGKAATIAFAAGVALICSLIVSTAVYFLRPVALAYEAIDFNRAIAEAAGLLTADVDRDDRAVVSAFLELEPFVVDLESGEFTRVADGTNADFRSAIDDPDRLVPIPDSLDVAGLDARPRLAPVYLLREADRIERIVLPFYARGMWSTIHGVIALETDLSTIAGIAFYAHGETPGIGDRIERSEWLDTWSGKRLYDETREFRFQIGREAAARSAEHGVDSITGATVTVDAVADAMGYWFSDHGYAPFLERLRDGGG